jgi:serine/threonine protein kinase
LIDQNGHAKITDFGVSKVIEDFSDVLKLANPTSSFAGSTRWLAPELIWAMVDDVTPRITTQSDVYAFGGVAMEVRSVLSFRGQMGIVSYFTHPQVLTGLVPFPLRKHDHGVTVDLLAGQKPSHCASMICIGVPYSHASALCEMMDDCWHKDPTSRPSMNSICQYLGRFTLENSPTPSMTTSR